VVNDQKRANLKGRSVNTTGLWVCPDDLGVKSERVVYDDHHTNRESLV
jgi:hypothetical protein